MRGRIRQRGLITTALIAAAFACPAAASAGMPCTHLPAAGERTVALTDQGVLRPFTLYVPGGRPARRGIPLVLNLHGSGSNGPQQMDISEMEPVAESNRFAVAAPNGAVAQAPDSFLWNVPGVPLISGGSVPAGTPNDEAYLLRVIGAVKRLLCVDTKQIFIAGFSGGARMASQMACDYAGKIAAIAPVAGLRAGVPAKGADGSWAPAGRTCRPERPVPILTFHGTADTTNPYAGNDDPRWGYGVETALARWAKLDGCRPGRRTTKQTETVDLLAFGGCRAGASVALYREEGAGHIWPGSTLAGSGSDDGSVNATRAMFRFFRQNPLP